MDTGSSNSVVIRLHAGRGTVKSGGSAIIESRGARYFDKFLTGK